MKRSLGRMFGHVSGGARVHLRVVDRRVSAVRLVATVFLAGVLVAASSAGRCEAAEPAAPNSAKSSAAATAEAGKSGESSPSHDHAPHLKMSEQQWAGFLVQRARYRNLPCFADSFQPLLLQKAASEVAPLPNRTLHIQAPPCFVELPEAFAVFPPRKIVIALDKTHEKYLQRTVEAVPYFPEINDVAFLYISTPGDVTLHATPLISSPLLQALAKLPNLRTLTFGGGTFSDEAMTALASCHSLRTLDLGRCRVTKKGFSKLAALKNLEEFCVTSGLEPDCFITLAKLPRLRRFRLRGPGEDFNRPIDEATRRAIASLDGRLEVFDTLGNEEHPTIHGTVVGALLKVKSLKALEIYTMGPGFTPADAEEFKTMTNLQYLSLPRDSSGDLSGMNFSGMKAEDLKKIQPIIDAAKARANANAQRLIDNRKASEKAGRKGS